jgi:hypothetical protein
LENIGSLSFILFLSIMLLLLPFFIKKYLKTKEKGYLLIFLGIITTILGFLIMYIYENLGKCISYVGYIIFIVGYFINIIAPSRVVMREIRKKVYFTIPFL